MPFSSTEKKAAPKQTVGGKEEHVEKEETTQKVPVGLIAGIAVGAVGAVVAAPFVLGAVGFTAGGIAAGSLAASMMSAAAVANGGAIAAGSAVAVLQSVGAAGLGVGGAAAVGSAGAAVGGAVGGVIDKLRSKHRTDENENNVDDEIKTLDVGLKKLINRACVMLFLKGSQDSSVQMVKLLKQHNIEYDSVDTMENPENLDLDGLKAFYGFEDYPQLFIEGKLIGGLESLKKLIESGRFPLKVPVQETIGEEATSKHE